MSNPQIEFNPPSELVLSMVDWAREANSCSLNVSCKQYYPGAYFSEELKNTSLAKYHHFWSTPPAFLTVMPNGRVCGELGGVISPDNKLIWDASIEWVGSPSEHSLLKREKLPLCTYLDETVAVLSCPGSHCYYHWLYDILPRVDLVRKRGLEIDKFVVNSTGLPYQEETLQMLGIPKEKIIRSTADLHIQAKTLVVPTHPGCTTKWAADFLRKEFSKYCNHDLHGLNRIYISRQNASWRRVLNEEEVMNILSPLGFQKVHLEKLSVSEQIRLLSTAQAIVAPHGAGLTNLTFCSPKTKVIEFFSPHYVDTTYWLLSDFAGLEYRPFFGTGVRPDRFKNSENYWTGADDIWVDGNQLQTILQTADL
ncbi:MAG TPA: glycosyltransferase family 61 protein [Bacillota bacterium]|nr:glycosyltransferase family 61 protein [Bacillota bacterium]